MVYPKVVYISINFYDEHSFLLSNRKISNSLSVDTEVRITIVHQNTIFLRKVRGPEIISLFINTNVCIFLFVRVEIFKSYLEGVLATHCTNM